MEINTKEEFLSAKREREMMERQIKGMYEEEVPKSHIAKHFGMEVYEVTKILTGKPIDVASMFFYKKYKDIAVNIYWQIKLHNKSLNEMAAKHHMKTWMARELLRCFEKTLKERVVKKHKKQDDDI